MTYVKRFMVPFISYDAILSSKSVKRDAQRERKRREVAYVEGVVNQIFTDAGKHIHAI